jgi:hypothetical protein
LQVSLEDLVPSDRVVHEISLYLSCKLAFGDVHLEQKLDKLLKFFVLS